MVKINAGRPRQVENFNQFVLATRGRPLLRQGDQRLLAGKFDVAVTITDNAVVSADLGLASVWDKTVQAMYGSAAAKLEAVFRLGGVQLYINDADFRGEVAALKESLDNLAYIHVIRSANTFDIPLRGHITESVDQPAGLTTAMLALAEDRSVFHGPPKRLYRPLQLDMKTDTLEFKVDTAINWGSGNIVGYVRLWGHLAPRDFPGAMVSDADACNASPTAAAASVGPVEYADFEQAGFGIINMGSVGGQQIVTG